MRSFRNFFVGKKFVTNRKLISAMADTGEAVRNETEIFFDDVKKREIQDLLANVVHKRKTFPSKCMKMYADGIRFEIRKLESAKIKLHDSRNKQFLKSVHKLREAEPVKISLKDLLEEEKKVLRYYEKLKDINLYLKRKRQHSSETL